MLSIGFCRQKSQDNSKYYIEYKLIDYCINNIDLKLNYRVGMYNYLMMSYQNMWIYSYIGCLLRFCFERRSKKNSHCKNIGMFCMLDGNLNIED